MARLSILLSMLGFVTATYLTIRFLRFVHLYWKPTTISRYHRASSWALVTGASDGIGLAFARELASKGFNIVLCGRNKVKLENVMRLMSKDYPNRSYRIVVADAADYDATKQNVANIASSFDEGGIGPLTVLVNNCGGSVMLSGGSGYLALDAHTYEDVDKIINVNARFWTHLTRVLLPVLAQSQPSLIINVGSGVGKLGFPYLSTYCGVKAYVNMWSEALTRELKMQGLDVDCLGLLVGQTTGVAHEQSPTNMFKPDATALAKAGLNRVGCGRPIVTPYWAHAVQDFIMGLFPEPLKSQIIISVAKDLMETRQKKK